VPAGRMLHQIYDETSSRANSAPPDSQPAAQTTQKPTHSHPKPPTSSLLSGATHKSALHLFQSNYGQ